MAEDLKSTLNLPATDFPMKAALATREPARFARWEADRLYERIQDKNAAGPTFVLHDGPPFTNGDVHIGTALNKSLKDITLRFRSMQGARTPYVPGWDCHGLPIEQKVMRELQAQSRQLPPPEVRRLCDAFSEGWIERQTRQFKRLGILADWAAQYKTKDPSYEADILRAFSAFVEQGLVYRSKKPVYWSIPFETALAEAEVEYREHVSPSIWVRFPVPAAEAARHGLPLDKPLSIVIWTTTPWTLPANLGIALHPEVEYVVADLGAERILVAHPLLQSVLGAAAFQGEPAVLVRRPGREWEGLAARHPFIDRPSPVLLAEYVTTDSGTGCVHTAPGHGAEDFQTGQRYGLEIYCPVGGDGRYVDDGRIPADLVGLTTLETVEDLEKKRTSPANIAVLRKLDALGALFAKARNPHSYPHCWRSKTPIIFRAVDQWFVSLDTHGARQRALEAIGGVRWVPSWGENRIRAAVEGRPDWCISRQRVWGVPIPAFYDAAGQAYLDAGVARAIADRIQSFGTNWWFESSAEKLLEGVALPAGWPPASALTPGRDTLDVWFDSGSSHLAVLKSRERAGLAWPADLYLEGSDQHRGWFQSALWNAVVACGGAPYREVLTHGFIVGKDGKKISKSGQYEKPPTSDNYVAQYGSDVIRLWIASQDFREDIRVSDLDKDLKDPGSILNIVAETYRLLRNTLRYQLGVLHDFDPSREALPLAELDPLDRWALHHAAVLRREVTAAYAAYEFHRVYQLCNQFCSVTLSALYHDILKDRLYTFARRSPQRRSSQTALARIFETLCKCLAPILVFTADEAWGWYRAKADYTTDSVHLQDWPAEIPGEFAPELAATFDGLLALRGSVNEKLEALRRSGRIGKSLEARITLCVPAGHALEASLQAYRAALPELLIVSAVAIERAPAGPESIGIDAAPAEGHRCPRCWRTVAELLPRGENTPVCPRCFDALTT